MTPRELDAWHMARALELALRGQGRVEPNPLVGCVIARGAEIIGEGWHGRYGGPHAEIEALAIAGARRRGATLYVTLEPCCHHGKTPPCTAALVAAGIQRVVAAQQDPFSKVAGQGLAELRKAGIAVEVGLRQTEAARLNAPYLKLLATARPWLIAKWAMTLDGKIASRSGDSRWISGEASRAIVHELRGRMDAILIGRQTALIDDPLLTARPPGPRIATRVVVDSRATLPSTSQLVRTAREVPLLVAVGPRAPASDCERLTDAGCEVFPCPALDPTERLGQLLAEMGQRRWTNVLCEGGGQLLGSLLDAGWIDEAHVFIAPKLLGGEQARSAISGVGFDTISAALSLEQAVYRQVGDDMYLQARVARPAG